MLSSINRIVIKKREKKSLFDSISPLDTVIETKMREIKGTKLEPVGWTVKKPFDIIVRPNSFCFGALSDIICFFWGRKSS